MKTIIFWFKFQGPIDDKLAMYEVMAQHQTGAKPLSLHIVAISHTTF